jgi:hypothetical protein
MDKELPIHPLENFPRQELFLGISRRQFFQTLAVEVELFSRRSEGASGTRISSLGCMADEELYEMIPRMISDGQFTILGQQLWGRPMGGRRQVALFDLDELSTFTFNQMNGVNSLSRVAATLVEHSALPYERAFAYTRGLFLTLVQRGVCLPINNPQLG